jgi:hypothetical protein
MGWGGNSPLDVERELDTSDVDFDRNSSRASPEVHQGVKPEIHKSVASSSSIDVQTTELDPDEYQRRMRRHIAMIRDFCDGLEYQLPFNDYRMLEVLELEGSQFLRLVEDCLQKEGRLRSSLLSSFEPNQEVDDPLSTG